MTRLSRSFARKRELIIVDAEISGPVATTEARLVVDTGAAATTLVPEVIVRIGYTPRDSYKKARVHTAVGEEHGLLDSRGPVHCARNNDARFRARRVPSRASGRRRTGRNELPATLQLRDPACRAPYPPRAHQSMMPGRSISCTADEHELHASSPADHTTMPHDHAARQQRRW